MALPDSAVLGLWLAACLRGNVGPDDLADAVRGEAPRHLVVGWPGGPDGFDLTLLPGAVRRAGAVSVRVAVPAPGDPVGLAGPPSFNATALEAGEAVLIDAAQPIGLVPVLDARTVVWQVAPAAIPPVADPREAAVALRDALHVATAELVRLDVASWQPDIPDLLMNLVHRAGLRVPPGTPQDRTECLDRAVLCREIVDLALDDQGGSVTAYEIESRRRCLTELDRAARRAIVASASDSLTPS